MRKTLKQSFASLLVLCITAGLMCANAFALDLAAGSGEGWTWDETSSTLTLDGAAVTEPVTLPDGANLVVNGDCSIVADGDSAITCEGALTITGAGKLTLTGTNGIKAASLSIRDIDVAFNGTTSCGVMVSSAAGTASVTLTGVDGSIEGGYAGIYVNGECTGSEACVVMDGCNLDVVSTATSWNNRARKSGITVYVSAAEQVDSSITIRNSRVNATGFDAGLSINNYLGDADATNSASSRINITNSTVTANGTSGTWAGIFASVLGQHPDADSIITITDSSVYAVSPNTGILTSSQAGESRIILNNSILGACGKTALSMIESTCQTQSAQLNDGSTYVQMTPAAVMNGEITVFDGKTIVAAAGDGITYDAENNCYRIPQGSVVTETFTDKDVREYTFNNQDGGIGGFGYAKEEIWGYDTSFKWESGDIIICTPEELIEFAGYTQDAALGNCEGRTVKLGADIDLSDYDWYYRNAQGTVVTDHRIPEFIGTFDGQGYTIKNMSYRDEYAQAAEMVPLSFIIQGKSVLKDLHIDGITVDTAAPAYFAGLVKDFAWSGGSSACAEGCSVQNIVVDSDADLAFGGMFYRLVGGEHVTDCHVKNFTVNANGALVGDNSGRSGGFVGTGGEPMAFSHCSVADLVINARSTGGHIGGFIGGASMTGSYTNCDVRGFELNATAKFSAVGGFMGYTAGSAWGSGMTIMDCDVTDLDISSTARISAAGGFIGYTYGQGKALDNGAHNFTGCTAAGSITTGADSKTGGFIGWLYGRSNGCAANFVDCGAAVNVYSDSYGGSFAGFHVPYDANVMYVDYTNCTASGDVFALEPMGSFVDADPSSTDGIIGGTYNYDPENIDAQTGESNNVAPGYRALDNGDGTWTVFPDLNMEVVKVAFHRWNDALNDGSGDYENWRTVEVFKDVDFFQSEHDNALNYSHPRYRFADGIGELDAEADDVTEQEFSYWTDIPFGTDLVLDNEIAVVSDIDVYAAYASDCKCPCGACTGSTADSDDDPCSRDENWHGGHDCDDKNGKGHEKDHKFDKNGKGHDYSDKNGRGHDRDNKNGKGKGHSDCGREDAIACGYCPCTCEGCVCCTEPEKPEYSKPECRNDN